MRPIDADAVKDVIAELNENGYDISPSDLALVRNILLRMPAIDAVPVVRCKDCKHYKFADNRAFGMPVKRCEWTGFEDVDDNDFCSRGERSEE